MLEKILDDPLMVVLQTIDEFKFFSPLVIYPLLILTKTQVPFQNLHLSNHLKHMSHFELKTFLVAKEKLQKVNQKRER